MEVMVKLGKTNTMTNTWGKTKTERWRIIYIYILPASLKSVKAPGAEAPRSVTGLAAF